MDQGHGCRTSHTPSEGQVMLPRGAFLEELALEERSPSGGPSTRGLHCARAHDGQPSARGGSERRGRSRGRSARELLRGDSARQLQRGARAARALRVWHCAELQLSEAVHVHVAGCARLHLCKCTALSASTISVYVTHERGLFCVQLSGSIWQPRVRVASASVGGRPADWTPVGPCLAVGPLRTVRSPPPLPCPHWVEALSCCAMSAGSS